MPHLKPYLNHFSSGYAICSVAGILLQQIFHIKAAAGALMLAAVSFTALYFVKKERRAPMRQEQYYLAKRCTMSAVLGILLLAVVFALSYAYAHGIDQARQWAKVIAEMWWLAGVAVAVAGVRADIFWRGNFCVWLFGKNGSEKNRAKITKQPAL
ncbi:ABZJ_00895 family protein [Kingella kingae]|uniref:ABZJ_00895 family protein n=1 Tax=Kingella kingae TaxID=504 RepID=UPI003AB80944